MASKRRSSLDAETDKVVDKLLEPTEKNELEPSNIAHVHPFEGMRLEIRDTDYIWSSGYIVKVTTKGKNVMVTVASDGWGREWDELMQWPNDRLAKLYTYTKQVKCNLDLLPKLKSRKPSKQVLEMLPKHAKHVHSTMWPVTVQFRMPHPGVKHARDTLRLEEKVFVKPYCVQMLPLFCQQLMVHDGGCWFHHSRLRLWKDDPNVFGVLHANYLAAFKVAQQDQAVKGLLLTRALDANSLLQEIYLSHDIRGCSIFDGVLREAQPPQKRQRLELVDEEGAGNDTQSEKPPSIVAIHSMVEGAETDKPEYSEPPKLPPPMVITDPLYPRSGVSKCKTTNQWVAFLSMNGNPVFLGSFPTESQAWLATRKARGENVEMPKTFVDAQHLDLQAVSMEAVIDAYESQYDPAVHTFSLHNWTLAKINYYCYMREKLSAETRTCQKGTAPKYERRSAKTDRKSKRKGHPRKLASRTGLAHATAT